MTEQTLRKSEKILKSYKGAQHILSSKPSIQFIIIGFMGVMGVLLFVALPFQNLIFFVLGLAVGIFWFRLFVLMLDAAIFRRQKESELKKQIEIEQQIHKVLDAEIPNLLSKEAIENLATKITDAVSNLIQPESISEEVKRSLTMANQSYQELKKELSEFKNKTEPRIDELEKNKSEKEQIINKKAQTKNNDENSEIPKDEKFE